MAQSAASEAGKKEGETRDLLPFKERGRETVNVDTVVVDAQQRWKWYFPSLSF